MQLTTSIDHTVAPTRSPERVRRGAMVATMIFGIVGFAGIALGVSAGMFREFDEAVLLAWRQSDELNVGGGPGWLLVAAKFFTTAGNAEGIVLAGLVVLAVLMARRAWRTAVWVTLTIAVGFAVSGMLKMYYQRPRPDIVPHWDDVASTSFPSQHAFVSAVTALTFAALLLRGDRRRGTRWAAVTLAVLFPALVGASRVVLGVHYPSDVLAGWCGGAAWFALCWLIYFGKKRPMRGPQKNR